MKRSKLGFRGRAPRRPGRRRTIGLESLERRELLAATLDPSFGIGGRAEFDFALVGGQNAQYGDVTQLADGSFLIVGAVTGPLGNRDFAIVKLDPDGNVDRSFNGTGARLVAFDVGGDNNDVASGVTIQPFDADNDSVFETYRIVVAGQVGGGYIGLARLRPDGSLDTDFQEGRVTAIIHDDDGLGFGSDAAVISKVNVEYHPQTTNLIVAAGNALYNFSGSKDVLILPGG